MRQLTLIRHGLTEWNKTGQFQGHTDIPLSQEGKEQAQLLAKHLEHVRDKVNLVYSSPLGRALETAKTVFPQHDILQDDRIKEVNFGIFEGSTQAENEKHEKWSWWYADPFKRQAPKGESYEDLRLRAVDWLKGLPEAEHIVAFAHSGTIQMLLSHVIGVERPLWRKRFYLRHSSMTRILFQDGHMMVERVNDARHLAPMKNDPFLD